MRWGIIREAELTFFSGGVDIFSRVVAIFLGGVEIFWGGVEIFSRVVAIFLGGVEIFWGGVEIFQMG